jgi:hypothetical protein
MLKLLGLILLLSAGCITYPKRVYLGEVDIYTCAGDECRVQLTTGDRYTIGGPVLVGDKVCLVGDYIFICNRWEKF